MEKNIGGEPEVRESKVNVYETVLNLVILEHVDELECIPHL
jgi:hypothetical protein